jgi:hypothetical protein
MGIGKRPRFDLLRQMTVGGDGGKAHEDRGAAHAVFRQHQQEETTAMMICPKCSQLAEPDRGAIADETVYQCKSCDLYTVERGAKWVEGGPCLISELRIIAESRDRKSEGA